MYSDPMLHIFCEFKLLLPMFSPWKNKIHLWGVSSPYEGSLAGSSMCKNCEMEDKFCTIWSLLFCTNAQRPLSGSTRYVVKERYVERKETKNSRKKEMSQISSNSNGEFFHCKIVVGYII